MFIYIIYHISVSDCDFVEKSIHSELQNKGLRNTKNREFFNIEPFDAIDILKKYEDSYHYDFTSIPNVDELEDEEIDPYIINYTFEQKNGTKCNDAKILLEKYKKEKNNFNKLILLKNAYELGSIEAGVELGIQYQYSEIFTDIECFDHIIDVVDKIANIDELKEDQILIESIDLYNKSYIPELFNHAVILSNCSGNFSFSRSLISTLFSEFRLDFEILILTLNSIVEFGGANEVINTKTYIKEYLKNSLKLDNIDIHNIDSLSPEILDIIKPLYTYHYKVITDIYLMLSSFFNNDCEYYEFMLETEDLDFKKRLVKAYLDFQIFQIGKRPSSSDTFYKLETINEYNLYLEKLDN